MTTKKCKGTNRLGEPCGSYPIKGSEYCREHRPCWHRAWPFWRKSWFFICLSLFLPLSICVYQKEDQEKIRNNQDEQSNKTDDVLEIMNTMCTTEQSRLLKEYNLGYALFAINRKLVITPAHCPDPVERGYKIDWSQARFLEKSATYIRIQCPEINGAIGTMNLFINDTTAYIPRNGREEELWTIGELSLGGRVLIDTRHGFVCVLGLKRAAEEE